MSQLPGLSGTETLMIEKTLAVKCYVAMHTLGKLSLLVFLSRVVC